MTRAIIYCRFSPRPDAETSTSNDRQEERCRAYCSTRAYEVGGVFPDPDVSGGTTDRPGLQGALAALTPDSVLVVDTSDRLARDMLVYLTIQIRVREAGARIEFADGTPPTTTPEGELVSNIFAAFAQYQRACIRKRTKAGLARKKASGVYLGKCPIGYMRQGGKLVENPEEQEIILYIMTLKARNWTPGDMVDPLRDTFGTIRGKPWQERTIHRIIKRESVKKTLDKPAIE